MNKSIDTAQATKLLNVGADTEPQLLGLEISWATNAEAISQVQLRYI